MPENINIDKTVFNKSQFVLAVDTKFSELFAQTSPITVDQFFVYYDDLFFEIPDKGNNSHEEMIQRSTEYLGEDPFEIERNDLLNQINELESRVTELEEIDPEHPVFTNGSLLRYSDFDTRPEGGVIFYMDKGIRRKLNPTTELVATIIKAQNPEARKLPPDEFSSAEYIQNVPSEIMDQIELGGDFTFNDFSGKNLKENKSKSSALLSKSIQQATEALNIGRVKTPSQKRKTTKKFITK